MASGSSRGGALPRRSDDAERRRSLARLPGGVPKGGPTDLDRVIHERARLAIVSALSVSGPLSFGVLKELLRTSDGNLSVHARKLEEAGYIATTKTFYGRVPRTEYRLTGAGQRALERYLDHMEAVIRTARRRSRGRTPRPGGSRGA